MTDSTFEGLDKVGSPVAFKSDLVAGAHTPYRKEDTTQRAALITALGLLASETKLETVRALLAGTLAVSGPLTDAQLNARGLATQTTLAAVLTALQGSTPAGEAFIGLVGGVTYVDNRTPVTSAATYAAGQVVGSLMTLTGMARVSGGSGLIQEVLVRCKTAQSTAQLDLVLFNANPTASTFTNAAALAINAADLSKVMAVIPLTDWKSLGTQSIAQAVQQARAYKLASGTSGFGVLVARSAITLASTSDLEVVTKAIQD